MGLPRQGRAHSCLKDKKMKQLTILLLIFTTVAVRAQNFNKECIFDNLSVVYMDVYPHEDTLVVTGLGSPGFYPYPAKLMFSRFDLAGNHISNTYAMYDSVKAYFPLNTIEKGDKVLTVGAGGYGNLIIDWGFVCMADKNYNIQWLKDYEPDNNNSAFQFRDGLITEDGSIVAVAVQLLGNSRTVVLTKFDSLGNPVWEHEYMENGFRYDPLSLLQWNDTTYLIGIKRYGNGQFSRNVILRVDTAGNYLGKWVDPRDRGQGVKKMLKTDDGGVIFVGHTAIPYGADYRVQAYVCRLDSSFNKLWELLAGAPSGFCAVDDCTHFGDFIRVSDGNYVAVGRSGDSTIINGEKYYKSKGTAVKFTPDGEIIWERLYSYANNYLEGEDEILKGVAELDDGSLVMCGQLLNHIADTVQRGWLLKTYPNGLIDSVNQVFDPGTVHLSDAVRVSPNPVTSYVDISYLPGKIKTLRIFDIQGHMVYTCKPGKSQVRVDTCGLAPGVYAVLVNGHYSTRFVIWR